MLLFSFNVELSTNHPEEMRLAVLAMIKVIKPEWKTTGIVYSWHAAEVKHPTNKSGSGFFASYKNETISGRLLDVDVKPFVGLENEVNYWKVSRERNLETTLLAVFKNGTINELSMGSPMNLEQLKLKDYDIQIAQFLGQYHRPMILSKDVKPVLIKNMRILLENIHQNADHEKIVPNAGNILQYQAEIDKLEEALRSCFWAHKLKPAYCHNNIRADSFFINETGELSLMNFEHSGPNFVLSDLAEMINSHSGESEGFEPYLTRFEETILVREYVEQSGLTLVHYQIVEIYKELILFKAISHFKWALWALFRLQKAKDQRTFSIFVKRLVQYEKLFAQWENRTEVSVVEDVYIV